MDEDVVRGFMGVLYSLQIPALTAFARPRESVVISHGGEPDPHESGC